MREGMGDVARVTVVVADEDKRTRPALLAATHAFRNHPPLREAGREFAKGPMHPAPKPLESENQSSRRREPSAG